MKAGSLKIGTVGFIRVRPASVEVNGGELGGLRRRPEAWGIIAEAMHL